MKKKPLVLLFSFLSCLALAFGLSACGESGSGNQTQTDGSQSGSVTQPPSGDNAGDDNPDPAQPPMHTHSPTLVAEKSATCTIAGNTAYYTCTCGKWFEDADAIVEITDQTSVVVAATGIHTPDARMVCTGCGITISATAGLQYTLNSDNVSYAVTGLGGVMDSQIYIASEYNGKPVTSIEYGAFYNCSSLTSITIPNGVTSIGNDAFRNCSSLTSITIPDSVTSIKNSFKAFSAGAIARGMFDTCEKLQYNVYDNAKYLGNRENPYLALIQATNRSIASCEINENTKVIAWNAFYGCSSLTSITIPNSVTSIERAAFCNCSSLTRIDFNGTTAQWEAISKGNYWNDNTGNHTVYCTDGKLDKNGNEIA